MTEQNLNTEQEPGAPANPLVVAPVTEEMREQLVAGRRRQERAAKRQLRDRVSVAQEHQHIRISRSGAVYMVDPRGAWRRIKGADSVAIAEHLEKQIRRAQLQGAVATEALESGKMLRKVMG